MGLPLLRSYLHGLYITALITVIITISPSEAACCQDNNNHCGAALSSLCKSSNLLPNSLYICEEGGDPSLIRICPDGCQAHVGGNDICKRVPVDNKTASQLLSDTELKQGQSLFSPDKKTKLLMQMNGNLVVSIIGADLTEKSVWSTGTSSLVQPPVSVRLLENGDLVLLNDKGETMWRLGTAGAKYAGASLWVRNGGLLCLANEPNGNCLWKSNAAVTSTPISKFVPVVTPDKMDANVTRDRGGFLVFAQGPSLWKLPGEDVGETRELTNISGETNRAVAVDCVNQHLYWTMVGKGIRRSRYDGSDNHLVVTKAHFYTELAVDFVAGNMFWVRGNALRVAKISHLEAGHKTIISHTGIILYSALAVHPSRGSIYWSHSYSTIETASMDGSNRQVLVTGVCAMSLALDYEANDLYWADQNTGNIECISLNGGGKRIVSAQGSKGQDSLGISLSGGRVYWTSYSNGTVKSITKSGSTMKQHSLPAGRSGELLGIVFVLKQCPKLSNACAVSNEGCPFIYLPLPENNKKCVCPDGNSFCTS